MLPMGACILCMTAANTPYTMSLAFSAFFGRFVCTNAQIILPTDWYICSCAALTVEVLLAVGTPLVFSFCKIVWNSYSVNSPPLPCMCLCDHGKCASKLSSNMVAWFAVYSG